MNPAEVLLSGDYTSLSPLPIPEEEVDSSPLNLDLQGPTIAVTPAVGSELSSDPTPESVAQILVAVNRTLGIDLGDLDYSQFIVTDSDDEDDNDRDRDGKREYTHIQLVCEACGYIIIAVSKAVNTALTEVGNDIEARNGIYKRKRGGILGFKELAAKAKLSPWHFHRVFRSITEVTPKAYGEACWDYLLRANGFDIEQKSPVLPEKANHLPAPTSGRISKPGSRSRSRSRPRHPSQTQQQVLSALTTQDEGVRKHRSRSAARSGSFSSRFIPDFNEPSMRVAQPVAAPQPAPSAQQLQHPVGSAPVNPGYGMNLNTGPHGSLNMPMQQPLSFMPPPGTVAGSIGQEYLYSNPPNMYENLYPDPYMNNMHTPQLDGTVDSTPSTGLETIPDDQPPSLYDLPDMPDLNVLTLSKEFDLKQDPSLAPSITEQEFSHRFIVDDDYDAVTQRGLTPDFSNVKLMDPLEEPSLFKIEY